MPIAQVQLTDFKLVVDLRDQGVGLPIFLARTWEDAETAAVKKLIRPGDSVVDIGANIGYFSALSAILATPTGRVYAFEPERHNYALLCEMIKRNQFSSIIPQQLALGDRDEQIQLFLSGDNLGDHRLYDHGISRSRSQIVNVTPLDAALGRLNCERIDFIKMDVQGFECRVVKGMMNTLDRNDKVHILMEFWPDGIKWAGDDPQYLLDNLTSLSFRPHLLTSNGDLIEVTRHALVDALPDTAPESRFVNVVFAR
jgi:FkbM family methyltransferase